MNVNEVIAHLASRALQHKAQSDAVIKVHPHDDVNLGQSSNFHESKPTPRMMKET